MKKVIIVVLVLILIALGSVFVFYNSNLKAVSKNSEEVNFVVDSGSTYYDVIKKLKSENLIKSELVFKIYVKLNGINKVDAGIYKLNKNMDVKEIVDVFEKGNTYNPDAIQITFKEGKNMRSIARTIKDNTNNTLDDVFNTLKDKEYLKSLIDEYWFLDDIILDNRIYYSLEGYLYPNTYEFKNKDVTVKDIFKRMLDEMNNKLSSVKNELEKSKYSVHEILTLASIVEIEGAKSSDRAGIAGVFFNRLNSNEPLGSDVTTYYAAKIELSDRDLYQAEINAKNDYNTRSSYLAGKLPIGPISNPSIESIKAVINPESHDYMYFVSDKTGKTYFTKTYKEHIQTRSDLIEAGLWYQYE